MRHFPLRKLPSPTNSGAESHVMVSKDVSRFRTAPAEKELQSLQRVTKDQCTRVEMHRIRGRARVCADLVQQRRFLSRSRRTGCNLHNTAVMSSQSKHKNDPRFGHLPLSTSGPQETTLTVIFLRRLLRTKMLITKTGQRTPQVALLQQRLSFFER